MSGRSKIEWTDAVWNPVTGCTKVSEGCRNCYAKRMAKRLSGRAGYPDRHWSPTLGWVGDPFKVQLRPERLDEPLHWRRPRRVFVCSMSDLFHPDVPDNFIAKVWGVMYHCAQHTFQVLTKRPQRMVQWLSRCGDSGGYSWITHDNTPPACALEGTGLVVGNPDRWPLPNVWCGTSIENQATADRRIAPLIRCQAVKLFISYEPALGPVTFPRWVYLPKPARGDFPFVDWVIAGGELGPGARPAHPDWFRSVRDQCAAAGVPFFLKQRGEWLEREEACEIVGDDTITAARPGQYAAIGKTFFHRVGKRSAGHLLDGREHREFPKADV